jgi:hypothetical protein
MDRLTARQLMMNRKNRKVPVPFSLPDLEELDGHLAIMEVPADELQEMTAMAEVPGGKVDNILAAAASIVRTLILIDTSERIYDDKDVGTVAKFGSLVLKPLSDMAADVNGLSPDAVEKAKKNLVKTPGSGSATSSPESSAATPKQS